LNQTVYPWPMQTASSSIGKNFTAWTDNITIRGQYWTYQWLDAIDWMAEISLMHQEFIKIIFGETSFGLEW